MKKIHRQTALLLILVFLAGCKSPDGQPADSIPLPPAAVEKQIESLEPEPVLSYEVPTVQPGLIINQIGYEPDSYKKAIIRAREFPERFFIVDALTGKVVYTGTPENAEYDEASGEYIGYGDFSDFSLEGEFYLECEEIGRSYSFVIRKGLYRELMEQAVLLLTEQRASYGEEDILKVCRSLSVLLLSYELYGPVYDAAVSEGEIPPIITEIKASVEWLLMMQDTETGAVTGKTAAGEAQTGAVSGDNLSVDAQTAWFTAVLAKFGYTYQKYDSKYATACLQAADRAWRFLDKENEQLAEEIFYAATELYRANGQYQFRKLVNTLGNQLVTDTENEALVLGALTYASTKRKVDVNLCENLIGMLFEEAEQLAEEAKTDTYLIGISLSEDCMQTFLWKMVKLSSVDYIITNQEYATIIESCHNYLGGANDLSLCYLQDERGERKAEEGLGESSVSSAEYIMILSEILSHKQEE